MATREEEIVLVFFTFMVVFLTFPLCKARIKPTLALLDCSVFFSYHCIFLDAAFSTIVVVDQAETKRALRCRRGRCMTYHSRHVRP